MPGVVAPLTLKAELSSLRSELAKIPDITDAEAKKMADKLEKSFKRAEKESRKTTKAIKKAQKQAAEESAQAWKDFGTKTAGVFLAAGTAAVALTQNVADTRNAIVDMSARTDVQTDTLEGLKLATQGAGREFEDLNEVINPLVGQMAQLRAGNDAVEEKYKNLGISVRDANGAFASNDEVLKRIVKRMQEAEDGSDKTAIAVGALGEGGGKLNQILGDIPLDTFIDQAAQFSIVGTEAAASSAQWERSMANLSLVMDSALASTSDFLNVQGLLDRFVVGFVAAGGSVGAVVDHVKFQMDLLSQVMAGDLVPGTEAWAEATEASKLTLDDVASAGTAAAVEFMKTNRAMKEGGKAAEEEGEKVGKLAAEHKAAAEAAKAQKQAEQDLAKVFNLAKNAVDDLADSRATASELLVNQSMEDIRAVEAASQKAIDSGAERVQAEAAAAVAIQAIRQKLRDDIETLQTEQLEDVTIPNLEREVDANIAAADAVTEKRQEASEEQEAIAQKLKEDLIGVAQEVTQAIIEGLAQQRANWVANEQDRVDSSIAALEAKDELTTKEAELLAKFQDDQATLLLMEFRRKRAAALGSIAMDTAAAIALGFAQFGPAGGAAAAIPVGAMGIAQAAVVLGQQPPTAHQGRAPDEFDTRLQQGEPVITAAANRRNPGVARALNMGAQIGDNSDRTAMLVVGGEPMGRVMLQQFSGDGPAGGVLNRQGVLR
jgi:hypothetical protein